MIVGALSRRAVIGAIALAPIAGLAGPAAAQTDTAAAESFLQGLGDQVVAVLRSRPAYAQAVQSFSGIVRNNFDIPTIGASALGAYWRQASEAERTEYLQLFEQMIVQTYTRRFMEYSGETFRVTGSRPDGPDVIVRSQIIRAQGAPPVAVDWRVRQGAGGLRILDAVIEGVSMMTTQRNEFASVIQRGGGQIQALLDAMRANIQRN